MSKPRPVVQLQDYPKKGTLVRIVTLRGRRRLVHKGRFERVGKVQVGHWWSDKQWALVNRFTHLDEQGNSCFIQMAIPAENIIEIKAVTKRVKNDVFYEKN